MFYSKRYSNLEGKEMSKTFLYANISSSFLAGDSCASRILNTIRKHVPYTMIRKCVETEDKMTFLMNIVEVSTYCDIEYLHQ